MYFPLQPIMEKGIKFTDFFSDLLDALNNPEALKTLQQDDLKDDLNRKKLKKCWKWLDRYLEMKPSFLGFKANINAAINELIFK